MWSVCVWSRLAVSERSHGAGSSGRIQLTMPMRLVTGVRTFRLEFWRVGSVVLVLYIIYRFGIWSKCQVSKFQVPANLIAPTEPKRNRLAAEPERGTAARIDPGSMRASSTSAHTGG